MRRSKAVHCVAFFAGRLLNNTKYAKHISHRLHRIRRGCELNKAGVSSAALSSTPACLPSQPPPKRYTAQASLIWTVRQFRALKRCWEGTGIKLSMFVILRFRPLFCRGLNLTAAILLVSCKLQKNLDAEAKVIGSISMPLFIHLFKL